MDDGQFPKEFIPHLNLGDYGSSRSYYAILYKNNTKQSKFTIEVESNATTGYSWYSVGIYEKAAIPNEPYQDSLKNIIDNDFVKRKISEGSTLDGLSVTPFDYSSSPSAHGVVGTSGVSKATISASSECKSGDYLVLLSYAQPFSPLTNCYYKKIYVRII
ncbi:hypothetical protein BMR1_03g01370 [Babesia microti strain RI]|uniref:Proteinase inhibitor I42 chagasin domain-containing protein n=1 Tax=Babesia microti (strain RI) TaxID=1133968 RepID=A0A0K3AQG5_BABMR|nr:hypothetical protein BMR1_03g01370 [Babesia microti strain RI]CTQ40873.1 hypothetical protein BMR1_03g01370 [Babesia microti strain RI]|eukprot:XP_012648884.1 hypothetical protein BMR1_03g01370 [Babesia microti strain RI]